MRSIVHACLVPWTLVAIFTLAIPNPAHAADCEPLAAQAVSVQGTVESQAPGESAWIAVTINQAFCPGDTIRVGENSRASLLLANQSVLRLNAGSSFTLEGTEGEATTVVDLKKGAAHFFSRVFNGLKVKTPFLTAGVRGTEFLIDVDRDRTAVTIFEGGVLAANDQGELSLSGGQSAEARQGQAPVLKTVVRPRDAVQWALYYPPVVYQAPSAGMAAQDTNDPRFLIQRASQRLSTGQVDAASADLDRALGLDAGNGDALALQSVIAVVRYDKDNALALANQAAQAAPRSAAPRIALSYAHQAGFDLERAKESLNQAVDLEPENALAWARLAELHLSFGDLDAANRAADRAASLDPDISRTQTVLGFARLSQVKTEAAMAAFTTAISLDSADPLPRLGLGLAKIREGNLAEGRQELETAASLDPNNSLIRSYLGKAYFEEKNSKYDGREYAEAKRLDPNDPTPWFYDAIRKQTVNRPVEALLDLQKAIELNDNRAVYRSRLLLDSDLAARSASQARIYKDLGFQQRALAEGYSSVNTDPANFSAHRFLADTYSALPRHEIARVSELLQSQLLQPINITPIQPGLAESNLFLISSSGAAQTAFNEFSPMFIRNRIAAQASGMVGDDSTSATEGVVSAIYGNFSLSAGASHFESDGWRENADQDDDIANFFAQWEITSKTSIQAEYRTREIERGSLELRFAPDDYLPNERQKEETDSWRVGFRHAFSPGSVLIGNFAFQDVKASLHDEYDIPPPPFLPPGTPPTLGVFEINTEEDATGGELQHLFRTEKLKLVVGAGSFDVETKDVITDAEYNPALDPPLLLFSDSTTEKRDIDHRNVYAYSNIRFPANVTWTIGASGDFFNTEDSDEESMDQFNPKIGVTWKPMPATTIRGAAFRTLKRTLVTNQTLEPTQVAGFNQFFDDANATDAWRYGLAMDHKFTDTTYAGLEWSHRDLEVPIESITFLPPPAPPVVGIKRVDWEEDLARAYVYTTIFDTLSLTAEYMYQEFKRTEVSPGFSVVKTHRIPLGAKIFCPFGFTLSLKGTFWEQEGKFLPQDVPPMAGNYESGSDSFWLFDAAISYRLPRRYGLITVGARNLFDEEYNYYDTNPTNPEIQPSRFVYAKITLVFP
jgi:tetratricopeptide (TPR) repeat protein